jgi:protein MpaA
VIFNELPSGKSIQGSDIKAFKTQEKAPNYLYLIGGTHGDEVEGVYVLSQLFNWLKDHHDAKDLPMVVVPILNPDGYEAGNRVNAHGVDLNRNYPSEDWSSEFKKDKYKPGLNALSEPENVYLDKLFHQFKPGFIISFHSWKRIINYNGDDSQDVAIAISKYNGYIISEDIGYSTPGSLGTYVPEKFGTGVITFECPVFDDELSLKSIWKENEQGLKNLFLNGDLHKKFNV